MRPLRSNTLLGFRGSPCAWLQPGEIVLAARGFCGWGCIARLQRKGVDVVRRAHPARKLNGRRMDLGQAAAGRNVAPGAVG